MYSCPAGDWPVICISLSDAEIARWDEAFRTTLDAKLRHRVQIVLLAHWGRRHADIAAGNRQLCYVAGIR